jgi:hypothetical protein
MTTLDKKKAFLHVVDAHHWLAAGGYAWNLVGPGGPREEAFNDDLPNIVVMIRDACLLHARSLIDFYTKKPSKDGIRDTDILLSDFASVTQFQDGQELAKYKKAVELHLLHLTEFRDADFRSEYQTTKDQLPTERPNWDSDLRPLIEKLLGCLLSVSSMPAGDRWPEAFKKLHEASISRYKDKAEWPSEFNDNGNLAAYLNSLGL